MLQLSFHCLFVEWNQVACPCWLLKTLLSDICLTLPYSWFTSWRVLQLHLARFEPWSHLHLHLCIFRTSGLRRTAFLWTPAGRICIYMTMIHSNLFSLNGMSCTTYWSSSCSYIMFISLLWPSFSSSLYNAFSISVLYSLIKCSTVASKICLFIHHHLWTGVCVLLPAWRVF